jgi:hypothetical protein
MLELKMKRLKYSYATARRPSDREILREMAIHGLRWEKLHGGYFSDPVIASVFIKKIIQNMKAFPPDVLVDLAGGTGYILNEVSKYHMNPAMRFVNIDLSGKQLSRNIHPKISNIRACISDFKRSAIDAQGKRFLFIMRSAFHYLGKDGIKPILEHLHSQMKKGEYFIHQSASFAFRKDVCCINSLYKEMGTEKWYPTVRELRKFLENAGWSIASVSRAPSLPLSSGDLARRYGLNRDAVMRIQKNLTGSFDETETLFMRKPGGFCAYLHYYIYTCVAV